MFDVHAALRKLVASKGSDLHLKVDSPPFRLIACRGTLGPDQGEEPLSAEDTERALHELLTDQVKLKEFSDDHEVDFSFEIAEVARFRVNAYRQRGLDLACLSCYPREDFEHRRAVVAFGGS